MAVHADATEAIETAVRAGADSIEHASGVDEGTAAFTAGYGTRMIPTLSGLEFTSTQGASLGLADSLVAKAQDAFQAVWRAATLASSIGVVIVAGTDAGVPAQPHGVVRSELKVFARMGLSQTDCLRAATSHAAD